MFGGYQQIAAISLALGDFDRAQSLNELQRVDLVLPIVEQCRAIPFDKALGLLDQSVQTSSESLRLTKLRYAAGESTALEVVDAQNAVVGAAISRADGIVRYESALASLQILTGTF